MTFFKDQDWGTIVAPTTQVLTGALVKEIKYVKPSGTPGVFAATIAANTTDLEYTLVDGDRDENGWWTFQAHVQFAGDLDGWGNIIKIFYEDHI